MILRGGSEAVESNRAIHAALVAGLDAAGLPADAVQLVPTTDRAAVGAMLAGEGVIDMIVPRGGKGLVARVQAEARVPVLAHLDGINHVFVHASADPAMAEAIAVNAKMRRTGICGAMETLLIDRGYPHAGRSDRAHSPRRAARCAATTARARSIPRSLAPPAADWDTEYLDAIASVALVDGLDGALAHIAAHGSHHTDAIVAEDAGVAERFLARGRQRDRAVERLDPVRRWRRVRARRRDRHRHRPPPRARPGRARRADDLQMARARHRAGAALNSRFRWF